MSYVYVSNVFVVNLNLKVRSLSTGSQTFRFRAEAAEGPRQCRQKPAADSTSRKGCGILSLFAPVRCILRGRDVIIMVCRVCDSTLRQRFTTRFLKQITCTWFQTNRWVLYICKNQCLCINFCFWAMHWCQIIFISKLLTTFPMIEKKQKNKSYIFLKICKADLSV